MNGSLPLYGHDANWDRNQRRRMNAIERVSGEGRTGRGIRMAKPLKGCNLQVTVRSSFLPIIKNGVSFSRIIIPLPPLLPSSLLPAAHLHNFLLPVRRRRGAFAGFAHRYG